MFEVWFFALMEEHKEDAKGNILTLQEEVTRSQAKLEVEEFHICTVPQVICCYGDQIKNVEIKNVRSTQLDTRNE